MTAYERACRETVVTYAINLRAMLIEGGLDKGQRTDTAERIAYVLVMDEEALEHLGPLREALGLEVPMRNASGPEPFAYGDWS